MHTFGRDEIRDALRHARPVVALETAVLTHGLPRPINLDAIRDMEQAVRAAGAVPATIGILDGQLIVGLSDAQLEELAICKGSIKASSRDLASVLARGGSAGLTVAGTLDVCRNLGLRVFATGGIGGVHRGWRETFDVSADLRAIASTPCCVVCSGVKAILDVPATLEHLDTLGVPVLGYRTDRFPQFWSAGSEAPRAPHRVESAAEAARVCRAHWIDLRLESGVVLANPVPESEALEHEEMERAVAAAIKRAESAGVRGAALTPFLLDAVAQATQGRSLRANLALLRANAALAAEVVIEMGRLPGASR